MYNARTANTDQALLSQIRCRRYDAPFEQELTSFNLAQSISVGRTTSGDASRCQNEGTDEALETVFQQIRHRVEVARQSVTISSGLSESRNQTSFRMAAWPKRCLEHAIQKSRICLVARDDERDPSGCHAACTQISADLVRLPKLSIEMQNSLSQGKRFSPDRTACGSAGLKSDPSSHIETCCASGVRGSSSSGL